MKEVRVTIQEYTVTEGDFGDTKEWVDGETYWAKLVPVGVNGQAQYQQAGYSNVDRILRFNRGLDLNMADYRYKIGDTLYEAIAPPDRRNMLSRERTEVAVKVINDE